MNENLKKNIENNTENQNNSEKIFGNFGKNPDFIDSLLEKREALETEKQKNKEKIITETRNKEKELKKEVSQENKSNEKFKSIELSEKDFINFTAMIVAEAKGEGELGMAAVGYAILNRVRLWKRSMNSILFQNGQYSPVADGRLAKARRQLTEQEKTLARNILNGTVKNPIGNATFFQATSKERGSRQRTAGTLTSPVIIGNHIFRTEKKFMKKRSGTRQIAI